MILKSPKSRLSAVNLFADFILNKIPKEHHSIIQVIDCLNFYVIKGKTSYGDLLNMSEVIEEFKVKYEKFLPHLVNGKKLSHTIDLIEYNQEFLELESLIFTYHNTDNCSYNYIQIKAYESDDSKSYDFNFHLKEITDESILTFSSEFPYGYSLSQGRSLYYYGKYIMYNIPKKNYVESITMQLNKTNPIENFDCNVDELRMPIIDMFDFDTTWLVTEMKKVDWGVEITNPLQEYDILKVKFEGLII